VLITGSSQGLGKALAEEFARRGFSLILSARRVEVLEEIASHLATTYAVEAKVVQADLSRPDGVESLWQWCKKQEIWPDILINNAGRGLFGCFEDQSELDLHHLLYLNIEAVTLLCHRFGPKMMGRQGMIVNVSSLVGLIPTPYFSVYSASKSYVLGFSQALAREWRSRGVMVSCLVPGYMRTCFDTGAGIQNEKYLSLSASLGMDVARVASYVVPHILKRKPLIYASRSQAWQAFVVKLFPVRLRSFVAYLFLKAFVQKRV